MYLHENVLSLVFKIILSSQSQLKLNNKTSLLNLFRLSQHSYYFPWVFYPVQRTLDNQNEWMCSLSVYNEKHITITAY